MKLCSPREQDESDLRAQTVVQQIDWERLAIVAAEMPQNLMNDRQVQEFTQLRPIRAGVRTMQHLTFKGYLDRYVPYLAGEYTRRASRLAELARTSPRLRAPLVLWAVATDRTERLAWALGEHTPLAEQLREVERMQARGELERTLQSDAGALSPEYAKAWRSYVSRRDAGMRDAAVKSAARERALQLAASKGVTRYRLAKDLGLNQGNLHAFLVKGEMRTLSPAKAKALVKYLEAA